MIPFLEQPVIHLGPATIHGFGIAVAVGIMLGVNVTERFCKRHNMDVPTITDLIWYALVFGFIGAHLFDLVAYNPEKIIADPLVLLRIWEGISSFGGMMAGVFGMFVFFKFKGKNMSTATKFRYVDAIAYGWPFAWIFGRLGCSMAIDHPGSLTSFFLGTSLETEAARDFIREVYMNAGMTVPVADEVLATLGFHNLGFYEMLYTLLIIAPATYLVGRTRRPPGFFLAFFLLMYTPIRFILDFFRLSDAEYFSLTPAQYACIAIFPVMVFFMVKVLRGGIADEEPVRGAGRKKSGAGR